MTSAARGAAAPARRREPAEAVAAAGLPAAISAPAPVAAPLDGGTLPRVEPDGLLAFEGQALGSPLRLFVDPIDPGGRQLDGPVADHAARAAWAVVCDEMAAVDRALSRFRDDSELTAVNRLAGSDRVVNVSWRMRTAVAAMDRARRITDGRFDAAVLSDLERLGERGASIAVEANGAVDVPVPPLLHRSSRLHAPPVPLDSGGIGKGLALRWAMSRAAAAGPRLALLLDAGGDVVAGGRRREGGWRIGIEDPADPAGEPVAVATIDRGAIATSSVGVRHWKAPDGRHVHHLVDPRTGEPARTGLISVTVAGPDPAWAEVWTKALFLTGRAGIGDEARARGLAAWWVDETGRLGMTPAARVQSEWVAEERVG